MIVGAEETLHIFPLTGRRYGKSITELKGPRCFECAKSLVCGGNSGKRIAEMAGGDYVKYPKSNVKPPSLSPLSHHAFEEFKRTIPSDITEEEAAAAFRAAACGAEYAFPRWTTKQQRVVASAVNEIHADGGLFGLFASKVEQYTRIGLVDTLKNCAVAYGHNGDNTKRVEFLRRALKIQEEQYGPENMQVASTLTELADALGTIRNSTTSNGCGGGCEQVECLERVLKLKEQHHGSDHLEVAMVLLSWGQRFRKKEKERILRLKRLSSQQQHSHCK